MGPPIFYERAQHPQTSLRGRQASSRRSSKQFAIYKIRPSAGASECEFECGVPVVRDRVANVCASFCLFCRRRRRLRTHILGKHTPHVTMYTLASRTGCPHLCVCALVPKRRSAVKPEKGMERIAHDDDSVAQRAQGLLACLSALSLTLYVCVSYVCRNTQCRI